MGDKEHEEFVENCKNRVMNSKNVIFHGAPGTGKTYLAREVAAAIIGCKPDALMDCECEDYEKYHNRYGFVQFHPSYDYTDFVEGYRPICHSENEGGGTQEDSDSRPLEFRLQPGIFKSFLKNAAEYAKDAEEDDNQYPCQYSQDCKYVCTHPCKCDFDAVWNCFLTTVEEKGDQGHEFALVLPDGERQKLRYWYRKGPDGKAGQIACAKKDYTQEDDGEFFFDKTIAKEIWTDTLSEKHQIDGPLLEAYRDLDILLKWHEPLEAERKQKACVFIIDEINRGDISKIFGELFFSIDPGYRGRKGAVATQYSNAHADVDEKLFVPENVYIIGTMNDIDRSVDSFDFAMRRRFNFIEITARHSYPMLGDTPEAHDAVRRLGNLNEMISESSGLGLGRSYQIGASYLIDPGSPQGEPRVLELQEVWDYRLEPLIREYLRGAYTDEKELAEQMAALAASFEVEPTRSETLLSQ